MKKEKGFTLIELLVVVAVIAILASTVLVNLRGARERAMDTRVISALGQTRAVAEIVFSRDGHYGNLCGPGNTTLRTADTVNGLDALQREMDDNNGIVTTGVACFAAGTDYCVSSQLNEPQPAFWCITSRGRSTRVTTTACTAAAVAPGSCGGL